MAWLLARRLGGIRRMRKRATQTGILGCAALLALVAGAAGLGGCQRTASPGWDRAALHGETFTARSPGLVLGNPTSPVARAYGPPWWADRRDGKLNVGGNLGRPEIVDYTVRTRDRQHSHDDHIHNSYHRSTRIRERGRLVR